jgi:hypothetical protein
MTIAKSHLWHRYRLSQAQVPLCLVRCVARSRCSQPLPSRPPRSALPGDGQSDHSTGRWARPVHRQVNVSGLDRLVLCRQKEPISVADLPGAAGSEADAQPGQGPVLAVRTSLPRSSLVRPSGDTPAPAGPQPGPPIQDTRLTGCRSTVRSFSGATRRGSLK